VFWHLVDLDSLEYFESSHDTPWFSQIFRMLPKFWKIRNSILCASGNILSQNMTCQSCQHYVTRLFQLVTRFWRIFENRLLVNLGSQLFRTSFQFFRQEFILLTEVFCHLVDLDSLEVFESSHDTAWFSKIFRKLPKFWKVRNSILCTSGKHFVSKYDLKSRQHYVTRLFQIVTRFWRIFENRLLVNLGSQLFRTSFQFFRQEFILLTEVFCHLVDLDSLEVFESSHDTAWFSKIFRKLPKFWKVRNSILCTSGKHFVSKYDLKSRKHYVTRLFQIVTRFWRIFENRLLVNLGSQLFRTSFQFFRQEFLLTEVFWHLVDLDSLEHFESSHDTAWFSKTFRKVPKFWKVRNSILCTSGNILSQNMTCQSCQHHVTRLFHILTIFWRIFENHLFVNLDGQLFRTSFQLCFGISFTWILCNILKIPLALRHPSPSSTHHVPLSPKPLVS
jgi:hypothetical protein